MREKGYVLSAGMAVLSSLLGMALVVQAAGRRNPPAYPITGIFFFAVGLILLAGLAGLVWDAIKADVRAINLLWFVSGGSLGCGVMTFYSVGLFFLIAALNWGIVALAVTARRKERPWRGLLLNLSMAGLFYLVLSLVRSLQGGW